jgi:hypothetical protein
MLASIAFLSTPVLTPANFECELVLISTSRHIAEWDQNMSWLAGFLDSQYPSKVVPAQQEDDVRVARQAVADLDVSKTPVVVMDGAAFSRSHYDPTRPRKLNVLASIGGVGKFQDGQRLIPYPQYVAELNSKTFGSSYSGFYFGPKTIAKGPRLSAKESLPTFCMTPIRQQVDLDFVEFGSAERVIATRPLALNFSPASVSETAEFIDKSDPTYKQICICAWGTQIPERPNLITFPPNGRAVRYKFGHKDGKWFADFVKAY